VTQTVAITGASAGLGRAVARLFGERGANIGLIARGYAGLEGAVREVERAGGVALAVSADVADFAQLEAAAARIEETLGPIDVWVNVAFASVYAPFARTTPEEFRRVTEITYLGFDQPAGPEREGPGAPERGSVRPVLSGGRASAPCRRAAPRCRPAWSRSRWPRPRCSSPCRRA
jgi:NAD(P)-dependent dehydrogenase (short-subunit alcohol dehydrogenase family)